MSSGENALILERAGPVAIIINNDAPVNRMTLEFIDQLEQIIPELADDKSVRVIIIRGAGDENFSVGMNLIFPAIRTSPLSRYRKVEISSSDFLIRACSGTVASSAGYPVTSSR